MSTGSADGSLSFEVDLSLKREKKTIGISTSTTTRDLFSLARQAFDLPNTSSIKLLHKGKMIGDGVDVGEHVQNDKSCSCCSSYSSPDANLHQTPHTTTAFPDLPKKKVRIIVMVSDAGAIQEMATKRSDPLVRGFDNARAVPQTALSHPWGPAGGQHKSYKFVRLVECSSHSFGHRPTSATPHAFQARAFLEKMACDPGIKAIMVERELVVNTLGEMDPVDDRVMQKTEAQGGCLLGYNTNHGLRIDIKLRTEDLAGFRPYDDVVRTLIHEVSHNWVGDHNVLFWANYAQMRIEYLYAHITLGRKGYLAAGKTSVTLAGLDTEFGNTTLSLDTVKDVVARDVAKEAAQHGIPLQLIMPAIEDRCREIFIEERNNGGIMKGYKLTNDGSNTIRSSTKGKNLRELALEAAERRRRKDSGL